mmetsp:Transcript_56334/g.146444  ORF Transcript_56334/g.146444 Transcript_56334/m.146444 type:complete len:226 (+) Transcript_56334:71-748(+)
MARSSVGRWDCIFSARKSLELSSDAKGSSLCITIEDRSHSTTPRPTCTTSLLQPISAGSSMIHTRTALPKASLRALFSSAAMGLKSAPIVNSSATGCGPARRGAVPSGRLEEQLPPPTAPWRAGKDLSRCIRPCPALPGHAVLADRCCLEAVRASGASSRGYTQARNSGASISPEWSTSMTENNSLISVLARPESGLNFLMKVANSALSREPLPLASTFWKYSFT